MQLVMLTRNDSFEFDVILVAQTANKNLPFKAMEYGKQEPSNKNLYLEQYLEDNGPCYNFPTRIGCNRIF